MCMYKTSMAAETWRRRVARAGRTPGSERNALDHLESPDTPTYISYIYIYTYIYIYMYYIYYHSFMHIYSIPRHQAPYLDGGGDVAEEGREGWAHARV